ncbi:MAG: DUF4340 domain-containing protein [Planctomycetes bacterium]|jgi:hypothetical protein|nr:DUF4340 domain-containing protein [Planctomycetota bacterium]
MGARGLLCLLLLALGLGAVLWFTDEKPPLQQTSAAMVLDGRSLTECLRMRWQFHKKPPIEVERSPDGGFRVSEPIMDLASPGYMKNIVDVWDGAQFEASKLADDEAGRQAAGLLPPELVFRAEFPDGKHVEVEVGGAGPLGDKETRFVRRGGRIWVGHQALFSSLQVGLDDLRDKRVFRTQPSQASELMVEQAVPGGKREAMRLVVKDGQWRLVAPIEGRADPATAQRFVVAVLSLVVTDFIAGVVTLPEREPDLVVQVRGAQGEENLKLWLERGDVFGVLPGRNVIFTSDNVQYVQAFQNAAESLRARILVPMGDSVTENLAELVLDPGQGRGDRLRLVRESQRWRLHEPVQFAAAPTPCNEAAHALQMLVVREFVSDDGPRPRAEDPRYGLGPALRTTLQVRAVDEKATTALWFGGETSRDGMASVYCCRADDPDTVVLVPKEHVDTLRRAWTDYCNKDVLKQTALVERLELAHRDGKQRVFRLHDGKWELEGTVGERAEVGDIANETLRDLGAVRVLPGSDARFTTPDWKLSLQRANRDEFAELLLWDGDGAPLLVRVKGVDQVVYELGALDGKVLRGLWQ